MNMNECLFSTQNKLGFPARMTPHSTLITRKRWKEARRSILEPFCVYFVKPRWGAAVRPVRIEAVLSEITASIQKPFWLGHINGGKKALARRRSRDHTTIQMPKMWCSPFRYFQNYKLSHEQLSQEQVILPNSLQTHSFLVPFPDSHPRLEWLSSWFQ